MSNIALVFPGQGSQSIGMLSDLASVYNEVVDTFAAASEALNYDLWELVQNGPEEKLNQTEYAQPALLAADVAVWRVWVSQNGTMPTFLAGHSLGEYAALVCAGAIQFSDALKLVADRGRFMQDAVPLGKGGMAAIVGLDEQQVLAICEEARQQNILAPANYNSVGQIVLAGEMPAIERAVVLAKNAGAKIAKILPVSVPSHCDLMKNAADKLSVKLKSIEIKKPMIPVINNVDVKSYAEAELIRDALVRQMYHPVRWVETIQLLLANEIKFILECGPGKVLTGLNKRIASGVECEFLGNVANMQKSLSMS